MLRAYFNYPNPHVTVHGAPGCPDVQKMRKQGQRWVRVDARSATEQLLGFAGTSHKFSATADTNDMWIEVEFGDPAFELAIVEHIRVQFARRYTLFGRAGTTRHCP